MIGFVFNDFINLLQIAAGLFDSHDIRAIISQSDRRLGLHVDTCSTRHIIEHHGQSRGRRNRFEVLVQSFLRGFVIIGAHAEDTVDAGKVAVAQFLYDGSRAISATPHENGHPSLHLFNDAIFDGLFLHHVQAGRFAGGSEDAQKVSTVVELVLYQPLDSIVIDASIGRKRSDEGNT